MDTVEQTAEVAINGLRRTVIIGLMGLLLCLGLSYEVPEYAENVTKPMSEKARQEYLAAHPVNYDDLAQDAFSAMDASGKSDEEKRQMFKGAAEKYTQAASEAFAVSADVYVNNILPGVRKKEQLVEFALLAGAGLLVALCGLLTSAVWTVIQSRQRVGQRMSSLFRFVFPQTDFNQPMLFSAKNYKELLWWTAAWLAAPLVIILGMSAEWVFGFYPLAVIISSFYIFSFWLTLAICARRGKLADPGKKAVPFHSVTVGICFFFTYVALLPGPLDLLVCLYILAKFYRYMKPPYWPYPAY